MKILAATLSRGRARAWTAGLVVILILWLLPLLGVALTSVRSVGELNQGELWGWPRDWQIVANYRALFTESNLGQFILSGLAIAVPATAGTVALSCMAGSILAKFPLKGSNLLLAVFVGGNLVPFQVLMIPVRDLMIALGLYDTRWALILFHTAFQVGFCTLFMRNVMRQIPDALIDTARMEGVGEFQLLWRVMLPLVLPAIGAISSLIFTFIWNDFFWSLTLVQSDDVRPATAALQSLRGMWLTSWNLVSAASLVVALPPLVIFFAMQQRFVSALSQSDAGD